MSYYGYGVPKDIRIAYMWLNLAAAQSWSDAISFRDALSKEMTKEQIAEAQKMSREWMAKHSE